MKHIRQVIVVEGKHDSDTLHKYFDCVTIETGGSALSEKTIELIKHACMTSGVIIFTDPDAPGNMIRNKINQAVPGCQNAFIDKKKARTSKKVGIEHAGREALEDALTHLVTFREDMERKLTTADMAELGLCGNEQATEKRRLVGERLYVGYGTAKTMLKRLNHLGVTKEEIRKVLEDA